MIPESSKYPLPLGYLTRTNTESVLSTVLWEEEPPQDIKTKIKTGTKKIANFFMFLFFKDKRNKFTITK